MSKSNMKTFNKKSFIRISSHLFLPSSSSSILLRRFSLPTSSSSSNRLSNNTKFINFAKPSSEHSDPQKPSRKHKFSAMVSGSELEDDKNTSTISRHHQQKYFKGNLKWEKLFVVSNILLEIFVLIFDRMGSIQDPQYGLIAWELTAAVMFVCVAELIYRGLVKEKMTFLQCLKSLVPCSSEKKPYSFIDGVILGFAKVQMALAAISYGYLRQGKENPISVSLVALIFISCFVLYKLFRNRFSKGSPALPVRQEN